MYYDIPCGKIQSGEPNKGVSPDFVCGEGGKFEQDAAVLDEVSIMPKNAGASVARRVIWRFLLVLTF